MNSKHEKLADLKAEVAKLEAEIAAEPRVLWVNMYGDDENYGYVGKSEAEAKANRHIAQGVAIPFIEAKPLTDEERKLLRYIESNLDLFRPESITVARALRTRVPEGV